MTATLDERNDTTPAATTARHLHPAVGLAMIATPLIKLAAVACLPGLKTSAADQLAVVATHPSRWYAYTLLMVVGSVVAIAAAIGMLQLGSSRMRRIGTIGGLLVTLGFVGSIIDCANQLWSWQMTATGADRTQMIALLNRYDTTAGTAILFAVTGIGLLIGTVLLTVALVRHPAIPSWAALAFAAAVFVNVIGFSNNSVPGVAASFVLLLVGMGGIGLTTLTRRSTTAAHTAQPAFV